jgi:hypothetical protein
MKKIIIFLLVILFIVSCQKNSWDDVLQENSIEAYSKFIEENPESEFLEIAKFKLDSLQNMTDSLAWIDSKNLNTALAYQNYIKEYPTGKYLEDAKKMLLETIAVEKWKQIEPKKSIADIYQFTQEYAGSKICDFAQAKLNEMLKKEFKTMYKDVVEFIEGISVDKNYVAVAPYIDKQLIYNDTTACFGVSGEGCDVNIQTIIADSSGYQNTNIYSALTCLAENYKNGGFERTYYDFDGTVREKEFFAYQLNYLPDGLKIIVYESYSEYTFTFARRNNKLYLIEILAYNEETDV